MSATLKSMTGFAQARVERNGWLLRMNLRSVNHRFLDIHLRMPEGFEPFEAEIRRQVREQLRRGHVDVTVQLEATGASAVHLNRTIASAYLDAAEKLRREHQLKEEPDLIALLRLPGVIESAALSVEESAVEINALVTECLGTALLRLEEMRQSEGRALAEEMRGRLARITEHSVRVGELAERIRPAYAKRLEGRLKELLGGAAVEPARITQEAALVAERGDIAEELERLRSHVRQFRKLLDGGGEIGKKLDFLLQEMQREANTLLSKTPGVEAEGLEVTDRGLEIKAEIEKLREQVQNVE